MMASKSSSITKTITVFRNGDGFFPGVKIVLNKRHVPTFDRLLDTLTLKIKAPFGAVRKLFTVKGVKVSGLDELHHGETYVAAGYEHFKKLDYCEKPKNPQSHKKTEEKIKPTEAPTAHRKKKTPVFANGEPLVPEARASCKTSTSERNDPSPAVGPVLCAQDVMKPVVQTKVEETGQKKRKLEFFSINVFTNGEALIPSMHIKFPRYAMKSMESILAIVGDIMCLRNGVKGLYTLEGQHVKYTTRLKLEGSYVAVGRGQFKPAQYFQGHRASHTNKCKDTPPVGATRQKKDVRYDAGRKTDCEVTATEKRKKENGKVEGPQQQTKGSRIPIVLSEGGCLSTRPDSFAASKNMGKPQKEEKIKPVVETNVEAAGNNKRKVEYFTINVFTNGEALIRPVPVKIPNSALKSMDSIFSVVAYTMCPHTGVKRLYTLEGHLVKDPKELKNEGEYVAVTRGKFKPIQYILDVPSQKKKCRNNCKETPPAVQTKRHKGVVRADAGKEVPAVANLKNKIGKEEGPKQETKMSRIPVLPSAVENPKPEMADVPEVQDEDQQLDRPADEDEISEKKNDIGIPSPSPHAASPHQFNLEMSAPAGSDKDVVDAGCQGEVELKASEQTEENVLQPEQPKEEQKVFSPIDVEKLLIQILQRCSMVYDFRSDPQSKYMSKEVKRAALSQMFEYVADENNIITEPLYPEIVNMCAANMFRTLPPLSIPQGAHSDSEEDKPTPEPAWPHLQLIYKFFLKFLEAPDFQLKIAEKYIGEEFVVKLLQLFRSEDPRERESVQETLCSIYEKFLGLRAFILKGIASFFCRFIYEREQPRGIAELLEILGWIIKNLEGPLSEEDKIIFFRILMPMHKVKALRGIQQQLVACIVQFLSKDITLTYLVVLSLLKYWPKTNSSKELMFIDELEVILQWMHASEFRKIREPLFKQLAKCVSSPNVEVARAVLEFCGKQHIARFISENAAQVLPVMLPALYICSKTELNEHIRYIVENILPPWFKENPLLLEHCLEQIRAEEEKKQVKSNKSEKLWMKIEKLADSNRQKTTSRVEHS